MPSLKLMPKSDRPREKLASQGIEFLNTQELLSLILGSGSAQIDVTRLAKQIEKLAETKKTLQLPDLTAIKGIGLAKAAQILAAVELAERLNPRVPDLILNSAEKVLAYLSELRFAEREQLVALYLNARHRLVHKEILAIGGLNQVSVTPRDVLSPIKHLPVLYIILAHNHPSGETNPSTDDIDFTVRIRQACQILGIELLDHLIITRTSQLSLKQTGFMPQNFASQPRYLLNT